MGHKGRARKPQAPPGRLHCMGSRLAGTSFTCLNTSSSDSAMVVSWMGSMAMLGGAGSQVGSQGGLRTKISL